MVNRIWLWHFGEGLVAARPTTSAGSASGPINLELLDWLARRFVDIRLVDQGDASADHALVDLPDVHRFEDVKAAQVDPENRLAGAFRSGAGSRPRPSATPSWPSAASSMRPWAARSCRRRIMRM